MIDLQMAILERIASDITVGIILGVIYAIILQIFHKKNKRSKELNIS